MLCIKIFGKNGSIISAEQLTDPVYVCYQTINKIVVRCSEVKAQGVLSLDGSQIYKLKGRTTMPGEYLLAEEISQADYDALIEELDIPDAPPEDDDPDDPTGGSNVMTAAEMREKIIDLTQQIEFLGDCLLEMSEVIYD